MAETPLDSGNRVTMAQVYRTVDDLGGRMDAHFDGVKVRLDILAPLPDKVAELDKRVSLLEDSDSDKRYRFGRLTSIAALVIATAALLLPFLPH